MEQRKTVDSKTEVKSMENKKIKVALLGLGTVGGGVYKLIQRRSESMIHTVGAELEVEKILVHSLHKKREGVDTELLTTDWKSIVNDPEIQIVIEVMGGIEPAKSMIEEALGAGKHVVTANKDLMAEHGGELLDLAAAHGCDLLFEASVAGAIPIIRPLKQCLAGNEISEVMGIVNGTTNYILTKMEREGAAFEEVLKEAQEKGYAERNPEADIEGYDACRKIAILSSLMCGKNVRYQDIYTEGITKITADDFKYAKVMDCTIKLLGLAKEENGGLYAMVSPFLISKNHPLSMVNDVFNAVCVHGNMLGDSMYYGRGAGKLPTASAVVSDVVDCARHIGKIITCFWDAEDVKLTNVDEVERAFFVRVEKAKEQEAKETFGDVKEVTAGVDGEFAFVTGRMSEKEFNEKAEKVGVISRIRFA